MGTGWRTERTPVLIKLGNGEALVPPPHLGGTASQRERGPGGSGTGQSGPSPCPPPRRPRGVVPRSAESIRTGHGSSSDLFLCRATTPRASHPLRGRPTGSTLRSVPRMKKGTGNCGFPRPLPLGPAPGACPPHAPPRTGL